MIQNQQQLHQHEENFSMARPKFPGRNEPQNSQNHIQVDSSRNQQSSEMVDEGESYNSFGLNDEDIYEVQAILDKRIKYGKPQYLIKWKDWDLPEYNTWENMTNLKNVKHMVDEFEKELKKKKLETSKPIQKKERAQPEAHKDTPNVQARKQQIQQRRRTQQRQQLEAKNKNRWEPSQIKSKDKGKQREYQRQRQRSKQRERERQRQRQRERERQRQRQRQRERDRQRQREKQRQRQRMRQKQRERDREGIRQSEKYRQKPKGDKNSQFSKAPIQIADKSDQQSYQLQMLTQPSYQNGLMKKISNQGPKFMEPVRLQSQKSIKSIDSSKIGEKKPQPTLSLGQISNYFVEQKEVGYQVDVIDSAGRVIGIRNVKSNDLRKNQPEKLREYLQEHLIDIERFNDMMSKSYDETAQKNIPRANSDE